MRQRPYADRAEAEAYARRLGRAAGRYLAALELEPLLAEVPLAGRRVLDVGTGTGRAATMALARGARSVTGVDVSASMLDVAREHVPGVRWAVMDVGALGFADGTFDAVIAVGVLESLSSPLTLSAAVRELVRVCRSGGRLALTAWNRDRPLPWAFIDLPPAATPVTRREIVDAAERAGSRVVSLRSTLFGPRRIVAPLLVAANAPIAGRAVLGGLMRADRALSASRWGLRGREWLVVCERT